jgi:hypothetical protein
VHYFLLLVCLLQWSTDFTCERAVKTSIRIMLHFCDIQLPFNSSIIHSVEHKLACCQHFKYCTYCKERLVFLLSSALKYVGSSLSSCTQYWTGPHWAEPRYALPNCHECSQKREQSTCSSYFSFIALV